MIDFIEMKKIAITGVELKTLAVNGIQVWKSGYTNQVLISTDIDGNIYNGCGYKEGYRVRSSGAEAIKNGASCTGYIPVCIGDIIRISGCEFTSEHGASNAINISDESFINLGQMAMNSTYGYGTLEGTSYGSNTSVTEEKTGVYKWIVPPKEYGAIAYIRVTGYAYDGSKMIVTVNEEIEE